VAAAAAVPDSPVAVSPAPFTANCPVTFQSRSGQKLRVSLFSFGSYHDDQLANARPTASDVQPLQLPQTGLTAPPEQQHDVHAACPVNINVVDGQSASLMPSFSGDICRLPRLRERHLYITNGTVAHVYINDVVTPRKQYQLSSSSRRWNFILKLEGTEMKYYYRDKQYFFDLSRYYTKLGKMQYWCVQCFTQTPWLREGMKGGDGEGAHQATFFCLLT
jgi:hypothetical protein